VEQIFHTIPGLQEDEAYIRRLQKEKSHIEYMQFVVEKTTYISGFPTRLITHTHTHTHTYIYIYIRHVQIHTG
jgi:hypothetical protein